MRTLVVVAAPSRCSPKYNLRIGWRIRCGNGEPYDVFWGRECSSGLAALTEAVREKYGEIEVLDLRERPEDERDKAYWEKHG